jgi:hypothetical protein
LKRLFLFLADKIKKKILVRRHGMLSKNVAKNDKRIKTRCLLVFILGNFLSVYTLLSAEDMMPYSKFKEINIDYWKSIQTGILATRLSNYELVGQNIMTKREWESKERAKNKVMFDINLSPEQKESIIQQIERIHREFDIPRISHASDTKKTSKIYTFDLPAGKSRIKEVSSDTNAFGNAATERIVLTSRDGNQLNYYNELEQAVLGKISTRGFSVQSSILYLGVILPEQFEELPKDVKIRKDTLDGREVIVYELSGDPKYPNDKFIIYADPLLGYRYVLLEGLSGGKIVRKIVAKNYKVFDGVPFPTYYEDTRYSKNDSNSIQKQETIEIENASFNRPNDPNDFRVTFTSNTEVIAIIDGQMARFKPSADKQSQKSLDEIVSQAKTSLLAK